MKRHESGSEFSPENPDKKSRAPANPDRRQFLKKAGQVLLGAGAIALTGKEFIESQIEHRSDEIGRISDFLRGEGQGVIELFGKEYNYENFAALIEKLMRPNAEPRRTTSALLDSFTYMMEVEDQFGGKFNTLPILESIDRVTEPVLDVASSFGYGQINAQTARGTALEKSEQLLAAGLLDKEKIERLNTEDISEREIVDILDLSGYGNVPISFLYFYKAYDQYGRTTQGRVHGVPERQRKRGTLSASRKVDPRAFGLAVSAYSAKIESPMVAKAQTYLNEMILADPELKSALTPYQLLETDGDLGANTLKVMNEVSRRLNIPELSENEGLDRLTALDAWLVAARPQWDRRVDNLLSLPKKDTMTLMEFVSRRYHGVLLLYNLLNRMFPAKKTWVRDTFLAFADTRKKDFVNLIDHKDVFEKEFGPNTHDQFITRLNRDLPNIINYDERYRGYIPMAYAAPSKSFADPKNIMMRVLLGHESDAGSQVSIPLK